MADDDAVIRADVQKSGVLWKKPFGHDSSKWSKRFFVLKDSFLLYYAEKDEKMFKDTHMFNTHPKGVIPLGGCLCTETSDAAKPFSFSIQHPDFGSSVLELAAETDTERSDWVAWIERCSEVTYKNALVGETMIKCLRAKTEVFDERRKETEGMLEEKTQQLEQEKALRETLEGQLEDLKKDQEQAEQQIQLLQQEQTERAQKIDETSSMIAEMEEKKKQLEEHARLLESQVTEITSKTQETEKEAEERLAKLESEKAALADATSKLIGSLELMEQRAAQLQEEREQTQAQLAQSEKQKEFIENEMKSVSEAANTLQAEVGTLSSERTAAVQQAAMEAEERRKLEQKLKLAEDSLFRLDKALRKAGVKVDVAVEKDVSSLKSFFETVLDDHFWDSQKSSIMERAVKARPDYERFETPIEATRKWRPVSPPSQPTGKPDASFYDTEPVAAPSATRDQ
eukprot:m.357107 g.357107  ORF g.357107 m.357107 type:complete len:456 (-) comp17704_c0_seq1:215-1582(-)